jgi:hypothetical protein
MHGKGTGSVLASANFLISYGESLQVGGRVLRAEPNAKEKGKLGEACGSGTEST